MVEGKGKGEQRRKRHRDRLGQEGKGNTVSSKLEKETRKQQAIFTHVLWFSLQRGEKRGGREQTGEVRNPASSDLPTLWLPCCVQYLISQSLESPQEGRSRTPEGWGGGEKDVHRST